MTLDEDAAKAVEDVLAQFPGAWVGGRQKIIFSIAMVAFGRRCAEAMRKETMDKVMVICNRQRDDHAKGLISAAAALAGCTDELQAIRRAEIGGK